jgi:hypothetical protein
VVGRRGKTGGKEAGVFPGRFSRSGKKYLQKGEN